MQQNWVSGLKAAIANKTITVKGAADLDEAKSSGVKRLQALTEDTFYEPVLTDFIQKEITGKEGILYREYHIRADNADAYLPVAAVKRRTSWEQIKVGRMAEGFKALWSAIEQTSVQGARATIGRGFAGLTLRQFSLGGTGGRLDYEFNDLFWGVEYGTGTAENVGGSQYVRGPEVGDHKEPDGSWWLVGKNTSRVHLFGQRGFHFLYDERTRLPKDLYRNYMESRFKQYVIEHLMR